MKRYSRNIALAEIGKDGQDILLNSSVLVIGAGGLGSPVLLYLAAAGVGTIGVMDSDRVELSNLQRQVIYTENSLGKSKVDAAARRILELNRDVKVIKHKFRFGGESEPKNRLTTANALQQYDIIADCSDNFTTRFLINDSCFNLKKTLVSAAATGFNGQLSTFKAHLGEGHPCYRCFCPALPPEDLMPNCLSGGILGSVTGVLGSLQATEIIKELLGIGESLSGYILIYDGLNSSFRKVRLNKNQACQICNITITKNHAAL